MHISKSKLNDLKFLFTKKEMEGRNLFVAEGWKTCEEALRSDYQIKEIFVLEKFLKNEKYQRILGEIQRKRIPLFWMTEIEATKLSNFTTAPGVLAMVARREQELSAGPILFLDRINDPGNLGTVMRSAAWFNWKNLILSEDSVSAYNYKVVQGSMGAFFYLNFLENIYGPKFLKAKKAEGYKVFCAELKDGAKALPEFTWPKSEKIILVMGSESHGISEEIRALSDQSLYIPKIQWGESLNVGVSTSIFLYDYTRSLDFKQKH